MKITIDLDDRHTIDGGDYVRILAVNDSPPPMDSVKVTERHTRSVEIRQGRKERPMLPEKATVRPQTREEAKKAAELVKQRNLDYEDRRNAEKALKAMREKNRLTEHVVEQNLSGRKVSQWNEERVKRLIDMMKAGQPYAKIGKELGTSEAAVGVEVCALRKKGLIEKVKRKADV